jgi:predicted amidohydrolase YtcJ
MSGIETVVLRSVEVDGDVVDVFVANERVEAIGQDLAVPRQAHEIDGRGGALLPGLHDHHLHLLATAAAARSVDVSLLEPDGFAGALRRADGSLPAGAWMRVVGYHDSVIGALDRGALDEIVRARPVRVQHATGAMWVFNSAAVDAVRLDRAPRERVERDRSGGITGRVFGLDDWLYRQLPRDPPDLAAVGRNLTRYGICGVTDMTPYRERGDLELLRTAVESGVIRQRIVVTGAPRLDREDLAPLIAGPAKVIVDDREPPGIDALADEITTAHVQHIAVALHCASRLGVVLAVAALEQAGSVRGDRIEHGAVLPPELFGRLRTMGITVVTQPSFVYARGDRYLSDVEPEDIAHLWRCRTLIAAGIPVGFGSDAPHGPLDPWAAIRAATTRRTRNGQSLGDSERVDAKQAMAGFLSSWHDPGGTPRSVQVGERADLCLLHVPLAEALRAPSAEGVRLTIIGGAVSCE